MKQFMAQESGMKNPSGDPIHATNVERGITKQKIVNDLVARTGLSQDKTQDYLDSWASSSGDHHALSVQNQYAVQDEFNLHDARTDHLGYTKERAIEMVKGTGRMSIADARTLARAEYNATQEKLHAAGIEHVTLFRAQSSSSVDVSIGTKGRVNMQPASSWSTSNKTTKTFGGTLLTTTVHRSRILSTSVTGRGCLKEAEVVLLGGPLNVKVASHYKPYKAKVAKVA